MRKSQIFLVLITAFTFGCGNHAFQEALGLLDDSSSSGETISKGGSSSSVVKGGSSSSIDKGYNFGPCVDGLVPIGTQTWKKCNSNIDPGKVGVSKCYGNDSANCAKYGRLYDFEAAQFACEQGFHIPSNAEWGKLFEYIKNDKGCRYPCEFGHLKVANGWNGSDSYGFSALPSGSGDDRGNFSSLGNVALWWTTTGCGGNPPSSTYDMGMGDNNSSLAGCQLRSYLYSVRCLKD